MVQTLSVADIRSGSGLNIVCSRHSQEVVPALSVADISSGSGSNTFRSRHKVRKWFKNYLLQTSSSGSSSNIFFADISSGRISNIVCNRFKFMKSFKHCL